MNELPHGLTPQDLNDELADLDSNFQVGPDITFDEYVAVVKYILRRRRRGAGATSGAISTITTTPAVLTVVSGSAIGTVVGTLAVTGGLGTYTFSFLSNPGGYFSIVGNQIRVAATLPAGPQVVPVQIQASNGLGDTPVLSTTITVLPSGTTPTYYLYGF